MTKMKMKVDSDMSTQCVSAANIPPSLRYENIALLATCLKDIDPRARKKTSAS